MFHRQTFSTYFIIAFFASYKNEVLLTSNLTLIAITVVEIVSYQFKKLFAAMP
jgi:hypothetical protein